MRYTLLIVLVCFLVACSKDKFTTAPQISFVSFNPQEYFQGTVDPAALPVLTIHVTDAEGDLGFKSGKDTSFVYLLNLRTNKFDSIALPDIGTATQKNFKADVAINMKQFLGVPNFAVKDTIYYKVYVKDFAKNKSNEITTDKPILYYP
ncbi:MAG: hypothetical protein JST86_17480 [Bacteroidetes bacterium]|nr:hypothetical protein [Bacteroidota bacterium]